jgi:hypothetical protein
MRCEEIMRSESRIFSTCSTFLTIRALNLNNGILRKQSNHSVAETLTNLRRELEEKGVTIFVSFLGFNLNVTGR